MNRGGFWRTESNQINIEINRSLAQFREKIHHWKQKNYKVRSERNLVC